MIWSFYSLKINYDHFYNYHIYQIYHHLYFYWHCFNMSEYDWQYPILLFVFKQFVKLAISFWQIC
jgi:hypothetical protein